MKSKNNDSFLSISSDEEEEEKEENSKNDKKNNSKKDKDKHIYHDLFKGIKKESLLNAEIKDKKKENEEEINKNYILKLREKLNKNTSKIKDKKLLILPPPENDLIDNHIHTKNILDDEDELNQNKGLSKLMNPDNLNYNKNDELNNNNNNGDINNKDIISINQKDILDSNWEIKYINKILKKDMKDAIKKEEESQNQNNQNNGKNMIKDGKKRKRDKNKNNEDEDEFEEDNIRSKYSKISTKRKYGW